MTTSERTRIVIVTRATPLEHLLARCGTRGQVEFYLRTRGQELAPYQDTHDRFTASLESVQAALPTHLRRVRVEREELDRFLFSPDDVVLVVGQDGLVANVAKYVDGQPVIGVNPDPERFDGILCRHTSVDVRELLLAYLGGSVRLELEKRAMALAEREDGQRLYALNEIFVSTLR